MTRRSFSLDCPRFGMGIWCQQFRRAPFEAFVSDIFREIDEELRRDNLLKLWSRYRRYIIGIAVFALVAAGGIIAWRDHQLSKRLAQSTHYAGALTLARDGKEADAIKVFVAIAHEGGGYAMLASFEEAALLAKSGEREAAAAAYDRIAAASEFDSNFRGLAVLLSVMQRLPEADPHTTIDRLTPLTASGNPWRPSALELTALARLKLEDKSGAVDLFKSLADDPATPQSLRARAAEMAIALAS
jgi:hypothetical protein